jgi:RHS repeat-associated protein
VLAQEWDAASRRTELSATIDTVADFVNAYSFDTLNRTTRIDQTDGAPSAGDVVSDKRVDLAYLADGRLDTISRYEDLAATALVATTAFDYDEAGRLIALDHMKGTTTLAAYDWQLDAAGRITSQSSTADGTSTFGYDNNWQITSADHASQTDESFSWDENGNPTMSGWVVDDNNRLTSDGTHSYLYDNEGNRTRNTTIATGDYVEYDWDHRNRLTDVRFKTSTGTLTKHVRYSYDQANRLVRRQLDSNGDATFDQAEGFAYDGADLILVFDETGSLTHRFLPDAATDAVFADEDALGEVLWSLTDHQGTVRDVANYDAGTDTTSVVNHLQYDSFGSISSQSNSAYEPYVAYTGMYRDPDTGLQKHGARWLDTTVRQWLSEDPIGFAAGDPNLRRYVGNSSANYVDPTGLDGVAQPNGQPVSEGYIGPIDYVDDTYFTFFWISSDTYYAGVKYGPIVTHENGYYFYSALNGADADSPQQFQELIAGAKQDYEFYKKLTAVAEKLAKDLDSGQFDRGEPYLPKSQAMDMLEAIVLAYGPGSEEAKSGMSQAELIEFAINWPKPLADVESAVSDVQKLEQLVGVEVLQEIASQLPHGAEALQAINFVGNVNTVSAALELGDALLKAQESHEHTIMAMSKLLALGESYAPFGVDKFLGFYATGAAGAAEDIRDLGHELFVRNAEQIMRELQATFKDAVLGSGWVQGVLDDYNP